MSLLSGEPVLAWDFLLPVGPGKEASASERREQLPAEQEGCSYNKMYLTCSVLLLMYFLTLKTLWKRVSGGVFPQQSRAKQSGVGEFHLIYCIAN